MTPANPDIIRRFVDRVINNQDLTVIDEIVHPHYVYRTPEQQLNGRQALRQLFTEYHKAFPDLHANINDLISTDEKVVLLFSLTGTHKNDFMGIPATGKSIHVHGMTYSRLENGQIIEEWELLDQFTMFQQLDMASA